jgi:nucleotide-binding universal stress UspA family protein
MAIKDLLVHLDETPASGARLQAALALAAPCRAHVTALYLVAEPFLPGMGGRHLPADLLREHMAHAEAEAEAVLAVARAEADRHGIAHALLGQAQDQAADLLVMGGYGHSRLREMMLGGTTRFMLEHTTVPVLLAH